MPRQLIPLVVATALMAACGTSDGSSISTAPDRSTSAATATSATTSSAAPAAAPATGSATTSTGSTAAESEVVALSAAAVDQIATQLHLLLPREPEASAILEMSPTYLWWYPTNVPEAVFLDDWWDLPAIGCGVYSSRGEDPAGVEAVLQLAVYPTSEAARAGVRSATGLARFADAAVPLAEWAPPRGLEDAAGFVVAADSEPGRFEEDPEAAAPVTRRWYSIGRVDRVVVIGGIMVQGDRPVGARLTDLMAAVAGRADRFGELLADPQARPAANPQPMPAILFAEPATFDSLGIDEIESGSWSVRRCPAGECREVYHDGELFTSLHLDTFAYVPHEVVDGLRRGRLQEALANWVAEAVLPANAEMDVAYSNRGLVRVLISTPDEVRLSVWGLHNASIVSIGLGDPDFETLAPALVTAFTTVLDTLVGI